MGVLTGTFKDLAGDTYTVTISSASASNGTLLLSDDPVHLVMPQSEDKYPGVRTVEAEINVITQNVMTWLYSDDPFATTVTVKRGSEVIFLGFVEPSQWKQPITPGRLNNVQIVAVDALAAVKNAIYTQRRLLQGKDLLDYVCTLNASITYTDASGYMNGYFSTEVFIGTDFDDKEAYTTYGDMLEHYARAMGVTLMMVGTEVKIYMVDSQTACLTSAESTINRTMLDVEVVPPIRELKGTWPQLPIFEEPVQEGALAYVPYRYDDVPEGEKWWGRMASAKNYTAYGWTGSLAGYTQKFVIFTEAAAETGDEYVLGVGAFLNAERAHIVVPYHGTFYLNKVKYKAEIHINPNRPEDMTAKKACAILCGGKNTYAEDLSNTSVAMKLGDNVAEPYAEYTSWLRDWGSEYDSADAAFRDKRWGTVGYQFEFADADLIACNGKVQLLVRSFDDAPGYAKNIAYYDNFVNSGDVELKLTSSRSLLLNSKTFDCKLVTPKSDDATPAILSCMGGIGLADTTLRSSTHKAMKRIFSQYSSSKIQYTGQFADTVMKTTANRMRKVSIYGKTCTLMAFDWNLRMNTTEMTLLEDA